MRDDDLKELMIKAARAAGDVLKHGFGRMQHSEMKGDSIKSVVTKFDKEAEEVILGILAPAGFGVVAEESGTHDASQEHVWTIDPLDGTSNFARGLPMFCVSIGLLKNNVPEMGVIYQPLRDELFFAQRGKGAYLNGVRLHVGAPLPYTTVGFDRGARGRGTYPFTGMDEFFTKYHSVRMLGTTALSLAYTAADFTDGFVTRATEPWDVVAGIVICEEAGLLVTDWRGGPWALSSPTLLVAKPALQQDFIERLG